MALLNKLFSSKKKNKLGYSNLGLNDSVSWKPFGFNKTQIRVIFFRECDWRGRKLLFDSSTVHRVEVKSNNGKLRFGTKQRCENKKNEIFVEVTNGYGYQYLKPKPDVNVLGEMIFGSVAMSFKGTAFKVHSMKSPDSLMFTKVFHSPAPHKKNNYVSDHSLEDSYSSSISSISELGTNSLQTNNSDSIIESAATGPLDVPVSEIRKKTAHSLEVDSGFYGDASLQSSSSMESRGIFGTLQCRSRSSSGSNLPGLMTNSNGSLASLRRRWWRSVNTSLDLDSNRSLDLERRTSSNVVDENGSQHQKQKTKLGLAIIITLTPEEEKSMHTFLLEHIAVMESIMERLRGSVEAAYLKRDVFVHLMVEGCQEVSNWISSLFVASRPICPIWLGITTSTHPLKDKIASTFLQDFCELIEELDTKATNFFVSTLVTAVLTHHLGWVSTVMSSKAFQSKFPGISPGVVSLMSSHPYNALWTQLGDLYGAVGFPTKLARTIVTATNVRKVDLLNKIINSLTYFIRCGMVEKRNSCAIPIDQDDWSSLADNCSMTSLVSTATLVDNSQYVCKTEHLLLEKAGQENSNYSFVNTKEKNGTNNTAIKHKKQNSLSSKTKLPQDSITIEAAEKEIIVNNEIDQKKHDTTEHSTGFINKTKSHSSLEESQLYPNLSNFENDDSHETFLNPEIISQKVSRLCRVTPNALLYHSQKSDSTIIENILPKKIDAERQLSSLDMTRKFPMQPLTNVKTCPKTHLPLPILDSNQNVGLDINPQGTASDKDSNSGEEKKSGVVFVLGDNDELVGLKDSNKLSDNNLQSAEIVSSFDRKVAQFDGPLNSQSVLCSSCMLSNYNFFVHKQNSSYQDKLNKCEDSLIDDEHRTQSICDQCGNSVGSIHKLDYQNSDHESVISKSVVDLSTGNRNYSDNNFYAGNQGSFSETERSGQKVVMVHSTVIELEEENAGIENSLYTSSGKQVTRSQSLTLPSCNKPVPIKSQMCRHHHEYVRNNYHNIKDLSKVHSYLNHCDHNCSSFESPSRDKKFENKNMESVNDIKVSTDLDHSLLHTHCCELKTKCRMNTNLQCSLCELCLKKCLESCNENFKSYLTKCNDINDSQNQEGNAMFDEYNTLSDEDTANNKEQENFQEKGKSYNDKTFVELPCPRFLDNSSGKLYSGLAASLLGGVNDSYVPDLILQACTQHYRNWENSLRRDLALTMRHSPLDQELVEAVCIVADADNWEVQLVSSHAYVVDQPGMLGVHVGMSQLVANMLESLLNLWHLRIPAEECLLHIESKLRELCLRSQAVSNLLLSTEFCDIATLASTLDLEVNDIPLLLAVASTHTPEVTQRYGLSFV